MKDVNAFLSGLGLERYAVNFADNEIEWSDLSRLTDADLKEMGIEALGPRRRILAAIATLDEDADAPEVRDAPPPPRAAPAAPIVAPPSPTVDRDEHRTQDVLSRPAEDDRPESILERLVEQALAVRDPAAEEELTHNPLRRSVAYLRAAMKLAEETEERERALARERGLGALDALRLQPRNEITRARHALELSNKVCMRCEFRGRLSVENGKIWCGTCGNFVSVRPLKSRELAPRLAEGEAALREADEEEAESDARMESIFGEGGSYAAISRADDADEGEETFVPTHRVDSNGRGGAYRTLAAALAAAGDGARILLVAGKHKGGVVIDKDVTIVGEEGAVLNGHEKPCITVNHASPVIRSLALKTHGGPSQGADPRALAAIVVNGGHPVFEQCMIGSQRGRGIDVCGAGSEATLIGTFISRCGDVGVYVDSHGQITMNICSIQACERGGIVLTTRASGSFDDVETSETRNGPGIALHQEASGRFVQCRSLDNHGAGVEITSGASPTMIECTFDRSRTSAGIHVHASGRGEFERCSATGNKSAGIAVSRGGQPRVLRCRFEGQVEHCGIHVYEAGAGFFEGCVCQNNKWNVHADPSSRPVFG